MAIYVRRRSFLFGCKGRTDTSTRILGAIHTVPKPIRHNPGVSLNLIISGHGFCGYPWHNPGVPLNVIISGHGYCEYPWLSRSEGGPFSLAAREGLTLVLGLGEPYILYPSQ